MISSIILENQDLSNVLPYFAVHLSVIWCALTPCPSSYSNHFCDLNYSMVKSGEKWLVFETESALLTLETIIDKNISPQGPFHSCS